MLQQRHCTFEITLAQVYQAEVFGRVAAHVGESQVCGQAFGLHTLLHSAVELPKLGETQREHALGEDRVVGKVQTIGMHGSRTCFRALIYDQVLCGLHIVPEEFDRPPIITLKRQRIEHIVLAGDHQSPVAELRC